MESACRKALSYTASPSLKSVQSILKSGQDKLLAEDAPARQEAPKAHKVTRGAGYADPAACVENIEYHPERRLDREQS